MPLFSIVGGINGIQTTYVTLEVFLARLVLITFPLSITIYFFSQFGHDRSLYEQYAFKAICMLSIESSVGLLDRALKNIAGTEKFNQITSFTIKTLESIYKGPTVYTKRIWSLRGGNKFLKFGHNF